MTAPPARSPGLMVAPFQDHWAVYDLTTHQVSLVSPLAGQLLASHPDDLDLFMAEAAEAAGLAEHEARHVVEHRLEATSDALMTAGLLGRTEPWECPGPVVVSRQPRDGALTGRTLPVLDERLAFRSTDRWLLNQIDRLLKGPSLPGAPTVIFDVEPTPAGGVTLHAAETWEFPDWSGFAIQLPGVINDFAARTNTSLVLHTGGVRTSHGRVLLVVGLPEAGKSTLTAALAAGGCDYLGDELIGVRADLQAVGYPRDLALDTISRRVLEQPGQPPIISDGPYVPNETIRPDCRAIDGEGGPVAEIILPRLDRSLVSVQTETLTPRAALEALLPSVMNLTQCGEGGWRTLCQLTCQVPIQRLHHPDATVAARYLLEEPTRAADALDR